MKNHKNLILFIIAIILIVPLLSKTNFIDIFPYVKYIDEVIGAFAFLWVFRHWNKISNYERKIVYLTTILLSIGLICTFQHQIQTGIFIVVMDAFQCTKCFIVFIYFNHVLFNMRDRDKIFIISRVNKILPMFMLIAFVFALLNLFSDIGMHDTIRFGLRAFCFICDKSGRFSDQIFFYLLFLGTGLILSWNRGFYKLILVVTLIIWMLTLRTRSIVYAPIFLFLFYWYIIKNKPVKKNYFVSIIFVLIILYLGAEKMESTYSDEGAGPRAIFLYSGLKLMREYFPLGLGFATFGTDMASKNYSQVYYDLGFQNLWGMSPEDPRYLHDTYWPAIMGQFGFVGVVIIVLVLFYICKEVKVKYSDNRLSATLAVFVLFTLLFNSTATPAFFVSYTVFLFMILPLTHLTILNNSRL